MMSIFTVKLLEQWHAGRAWQCRVLPLIALLASVLAATGAAAAQPRAVMLKGGGQMLYHDTGHGDEAVLLLHGHTLDHRMWDREVELLKGRYRVVVPDLRGYGKSSDPPEGYQFTHADDVIALMDSLGIEKAHVVGLSMGAYVAGDMVALFPERLLSCVMVSGETCNFTGPGKPRSAKEIAERKQSIKKVEADVERYKRRRVAGLLSACHPANREKIRDELTREIMDWGAWQALHVTTRVYYGEQALARLKKSGSNVPALIIYGKSEKVTRGYTLPYLPCGKLIVFKKCGHMVNLEQPQQFDETLLHWLEHCGTLNEESKQP